MTSHYCSPQTTVGYFSTSSADDPRGLEAATKRAQLMVPKNQHFFKCLTRARLPVYKTCNIFLPSWRGFRSVTSKNPMSAGTSFLRLDRATFRSPCFGILHSFPCLPVLALYLHGASVIWMLVTRKQSQRNLPLESVRQTSGKPPPFCRWVRTSPRTLRARHKLRRLRSVGCYMFGWTVGLHFSRADSVSRNNRNRLMEGPFFNASTLRTGRTSKTVSDRTPRSF